MSDARQILRHWQEAVPEDRLAHLIRDAARALTRAMTLRLAQHGVAFGHWAFLRVLWVQDGLTQRELSDQVGVMEPTTVTALRAMELRGWIRREQLPDDRRKIHVHLTQAGRDLQALLVPLAEQANEVAVRGIPPAEVGRLRTALLRVIGNLATEDEPPGAATRPPRPARTRKSPRPDSAP